MIRKPFLFVGAAMGPQGGRPVAVLAGLWPQFRRSSTRVAARD
jgi:hypothetical protein